MNNTRKGIVFGLFLFIFIYLLLRAYFTEPLHDEIATFYFFIYHGDFFGEQIVWDANNHLLNSFIGRGIYLLFGDHFFLLRLPNILAFGLYFWSGYKLLSKLKSENLKVMGMIALSMVPFVTEYFANCRGYGISLGFFLFALYQTTNYIDKQKFSYYIWALLAMLLAISANLTMLNVSLILLAYIGFVGVTNKRINVSFILATGLFLIAIVPFILFGFELKAHGALYYGSLDGLWDVTGSTLVKYVFFGEGQLAFWVTTFVLVGLLIHFGFFIKGKHWRENLLSPLTLFTWLFFFNLIGIVFLAEVLEVNYPEDRTGMYLIPLFILQVLWIFDRYDKQLLFAPIALFFIIVFGFKMSLHTSVFSPDDRMTDAFYQEVKKEIKPEYSIMTYGIMSWNWPHHESKSKEKASVGMTYNANATITDIILTKTTVLKNPEIVELYDTIAYDPSSTYIAFKRKTAIEKSIVFESEPKLSEGNGEYLTIFESDSLPVLNSMYPIQITASFDLYTEDKRNYMHLVIQTIDTNEQLVDYLYYPIDVVYHDQKIDETLIHHFVIENWNPSIKTLKVFLWNKGRSEAQIKNGKCYLYEVKTPEHGTR